ncbi:hypothetical protein GQX73_g10215 [Xylaria multiplex]|uniref:Uncharacterized protein n=1 Tax=Xylaria multiplex TaxID=323545 RepID=A0A7C8MXM3_9PEZI|nr:hypothetical protein GQX73_g10215 [Xylaria multiplex]
MALGSDDNPNNGPSQPFAYVLIPILGFGLIISLITCYRYRRKKQRLARLAADDPTVIRDIEAGRTRLDRGPNGIVIVGNERGRRTRGRSRRLGLGIGSREEGLNELGEAPPAYTPNAPKPPSEVGAVGVVENVELTTYSQASAEAGTSRSPPSYGDEPAARPGETAVASTSNAADATRLSEEMRRDAPAAPKASASRGPPDYSEPPSGTGAGPATGTTTETTRSASDTARSSEEASGNTRGNSTATTATTATPPPPVAGTTTISATDEPAPPPRAVLPPSSD